MKWQSPCSIGQEPSDQFTDRIARAFVPLSRNPKTSFYIPKSVPHLGFVQGDGPGPIIGLPQGWKDLRGRRSPLKKL